MNLKTEKTLQFFYFLILIILSILLSILSDSNIGDSLANSFLKKSLVIAIFILMIFIAGLFKGSTTNYIAFFSPFLLNLSRPFIFYDNFLTLPQIISDKSIGLLQFYLFTTFLILYFMKLENYSKRSAFDSYKPFFFFALLSVFWAISPEAVFPQILILLVLPASYSIFNKIFSHNPKSIYFFFSGLLFATLLTSVTTWPSYLGYQWFDFLTNKENDLIGGQIRTGGFLSKTDLAHFLVLSIPALTGFLIERVKDVKVHTKFFLLFLLVLTITLTFNRAHVALSILGLMLVLLKSNKLGYLKINFFQIGVLTLTILIAMFLVSLLNVVSAEDIIFRDTLETRGLQILAGFEVGMNSLFLGVGLSNFLLTKEAVQILGSNSWNISEGISIHNEYIKVFSELGLVGLTLFIYFLISIFKRYMHNKSLLSYSILVNLLVLYLLSITSSPFSRPENLFLIGAYIAVLDYERNERNLDFSV